MRTRLKEKMVIATKTFTIVAGVNGAGKSSLTGILRRELVSLGEIVDANEIAAQCHGNAIEGRKKAVEIIEDCLEKGICFTQETTLSGHKTLTTVKRAIDKGYWIRLYYVGLSTLEESLSRIENRVRKGGHDIREADVTRRYEKRFKDLLAILPYCNEATFYDNENGFVAVAEYKNGVIFPIGYPSPLWLTELLTEMDSAN